jgi:hypothetical protein
VKVARQDLEKVASTDMTSGRQRCEREALERNLHDRS